MSGGRVVRWLCGTAGAVLVPVVAVVAPTATAGVAVATAGPSFHPIVPARIMDTRSGIGTDASPLGGGETRALQVTGQADIPADAVAVALNVTVTEPTVATYLTVWPAGAAQPTASNVNVVAGQTVANMVTVGLGSGGQIDLFNFAGAAQVVVDVTGWYADGFQAVVPVRVVDTRSGVGGPTFQPGESRDVDLSTAGVPAGATAVVANVTAVNASAATYVTAWPSGAAMPTASNLNVVPGQTVPNMVTVGLGPNGHISLFNYAGTTDLVVDVAGWYTTGFHPVTPARIADTRSGQCGVRLGPGETRQVAVTGLAGVPADTAGAVALNVTIVNPTANTYLTVWPSGAPQPTASNLNALAGTVPNMVTTGLGADGRVSVYNFAGTADVIIDVAGWFDGTGGVAQADGCVSSGAPAPAPNAELALPPVAPLTAVGRGTPAATISAIQQRLDTLGFWVPDYDGVFGPVTSQAVLAFQKYLGLPLSGQVDDLTALALNMDGLRAAGQSTSGDRMEVDLTRQLLFVIRGGRTVYTVNTSTGSGAFYDEPNQKDGGRISGTAITPVGHFRVYREFSDGWEPGQLGDLYRPKYFTGGVAVHGAPRIPSVPASHGCVRVTTTFMDFVWAANLMPMGSEVWTHN
jgi:peptidoglycan hydrolase-like protein with peptidoglycan-binding domain